MGNFYRVLLLAGSLCVMFCSSFAQSTDFFLGSMDLFTSSSKRQVFYVNEDGTGFDYPLPEVYDESWGTNNTNIIIGTDNNVYGLVRTQGSLLYKITKDGVFKIHDFEYAEHGPIMQARDGFIYKFSAGADGNYVDIVRIAPDGSGLATHAFYKPNFRPSKLLLASDGAIYGVSTAGGANSGSGYVFKFTPTSDLKDFKVIYNFSLTTGRKPVGALIEGTDGFLYGVTATGGANDSGTIFKMAKDGSQHTILYNFKHATGRYPSMGIVTDGAGWLYGTTTKGAAYGDGAIFKVRTNGSDYAVMYNFLYTYSLPADAMSGNIIYHKGNIYGYHNGNQQASRPLYIYRLRVSDNNYSQFVLFPTDIPYGGNDLIVNKAPFTPDVFVTKPANNGNVSRYDNVQISINPVQAARHYILELSLTSDFAQINRRYQSVSPDFTVTDLEANKKYYARVKSNVWPVYGQVTSFTTTPLVVNNNYISNPANGAVNVSAPSLKVTAGTVTGAKRYTIELSTTEDFANPIVKTSTVDNQRTLTFTVAYKTKYYGRFKTDISDYGRVTSFTTRAEQFVTLTQPEHESTEIDPLVVELEAAEIFQAKRYTVQLSTTPDFSANTIELTSVGDFQKSFIVKDLEHATRYYARMKADVSTNYGPVTHFDTREPIARKSLWGVTAYGGANNLGTVFSYSIDGGQFTKHFDYLEENPDSEKRIDGNMIPAPNGEFYFHTGTPGSSSYEGDLFKIDAQGNASYVYSIGSYDGNIMLASDNHIYSAINSHLGPGVIDKYSVDDQSWEHLYIFRGGWGGLDPGSELLELHDGYLYGRATLEGANDGGTLYRLRYDGSGFQVIHNFATSTGRYPRGDLFYGPDGYIYGTTEGGGAFNQGTVYKIRPDGTNHTVIFQFDGLNGSQPYGGVIIADGVLYGTTRDGGSTNGTIFRMAPDGSGFQNLHNFSYTDGALPEAKLTYDDGVLYGITTSGGSAGMGVIFRINTNGSGYQVLQHLDGETGGHSDGYLVLREDTFDPSTAVASAALDESKIISVHPNPSTTNFTIALQTPMERISEELPEVEIELTDLNGHVIEKSLLSSQNDWKVGDALSRGIYILRVTKNGKTTMHRIVKK